MGENHWTCFYIKDNADSTSHADSASEAFNLDSSGGQPDKFLLQQLPKPIIFHYDKIQVISSEICGVYCLYFLPNRENGLLSRCFLKIYFDWGKCW